MRVSAFAPGRVNLIGDHTDHTGGLVLPMAIEWGTTVSGIRGGGRVQLTSADASDTADLPLVVEHPDRARPVWARYVAGVVAELGPSEGMVGEVRSTLPVGSGLSSSAALTVAVALALGAPGDQPVAVAELCRRAEERALGVPCGLMDQLAAVAGRAGHALLIDTGARSWTHVAIPAGVEVRLVDSGEPRTLAGSRYGEVRERCVRARDALGSLVACQPDAWRSIIDAPTRRAGRHVISENRRVRAMGVALEAGRFDDAGRLMSESHRSLAVDLGVSTPALDATVARLEATPGVFGARLTGAGFGGWVVALCEPGALEEGHAAVPSDGASVAVTPASG